LLDVVLLDVVLFDIITIRIRASPFEQQAGRTMDPAEARLFLRKFVDDDDNHVARKCAAFVSAATLERAHDPARPEEHPLSGTIVLTNGVLLVGETHANLSAIYNVKYYL
jgi:hypothetical protein